MEWFKEVFNVVMLMSILTSAQTLIASVGLILATSSFISGLQIVKGTRTSVEGKIHRINGVIVITLYVILAARASVINGITWNILWWVLGMCVILLKLKIVRTKGRAFKYVSWLGGTLILIWLYLVYIHLPV
ncbi:MAG: hypothetical protein HY884_08305 [Deltaproteobacteria bacterium]|nr:hypothetical protein [Deltaproteobacteria bacterium]